MKRLIDTSPARLERTHLPPAPSERDGQHGFDLDEINQKALRRIQRDLDRLSKQAAANAEENARLRAQNAKILNLTKAFASMSRTLMQSDPGSPQGRAIADALSELITTIEAFKPE